MKRFIIIIFLPILIACKFEIPFDETQVIYEQDDTLVQVLVDLWPHHELIEKYKNHETENKITGQLLSYLKKHVISSLEHPYEKFSIEFVHVDSTDNYGQPDYANKTSLGFLEIQDLNGNLVIKKNTFSLKTGSG